MIRRLTVLLTGLMCFTSVAANGESLLSSFPRAISSEHVYKVIIREIDSQPVEPQRQYTIATGLHDISVQLMLNLQWTLDQSEQPAKSYLQTLQLDVQPGKHYQLAARVDIDASSQSLEEGSFWSVVVYRETDL